MRRFSTGLPKDDRAAQEWRMEKARCAAKLRKAEKEERYITERCLLDAAREVVRKWATHDLAAAVRDLDLAIKEYEEVRK